MVFSQSTGVQKHFHMLSIANDLRSHGYAYSPTSGAHTRIPGIWTKLRNLYDLDALDERENRHSGWSNTPEPEAQEGDEDEDGWQEFSLPEEDFGEAIWLRRFPRRKSTQNDTQNEGEDVEMQDADAVSRDSTPETIPGLNETWAGVRDRPAHVQALVDRVAGMAATEEEDTPSTKGKGKKGAVARSVSGRTRATRSTPAQETEEDDEDGDEEDESTAAGTPPVTKSQAKSTKKKPTRKSTRKR
jgi:MRG-binding protein